MKTILVPTDFSITADYAIHFSVELTKYHDASIILYHAFIPFESSFYPPAQRKAENLETENNLIKRLSKIKDTILKSNKNSSIAIHVDRGPESIRLKEFCRKKKIDLIIMGTTGASGIKEVIMGSFTADIMIKAPCPVLAIPKKYKFKIPEKIMFASDYQFNDIPAIKYLAEFNRPFKAKISILHIDDGEKKTAPEEKIIAKYQQKIKEKCEGVPLVIQHIAGHDIAKAILQITLNDKTDILAISPQKRQGFWDRLLNRSITKTVAYHIPVPLLSIPGK